MSSFGRENNSEKSWTESAPPPLPQVRLIRKHCSGISTVYPTDQETVRGLHVRTQTTTKTGFRRQGYRNCQVRTL